MIYAVLSLVFVGPGLLPGRTLSNADMLWSGAPWTADAPEGVRYGGANFELADTTAVFLPFYEHAKRVLPDAPLWNPYIMAGRPFLANAQSAVLSPFMAPVYFLSLWKALAVVAALKLFVAAFGTYLLGRALGMRFGGGLLAGVVFAFGTFFVAWLGWPLTNIFPLLPFVLLLTELLVRRPGPLPAAGLAAVVGMTFFGGHPETTFHVLVATVVFFAFRLWQSREAPLRTTLLFGGALALGAALAAVMLIPLAELFLHSGDYAHRLDVAPGHTEARFLGAFFLSDYWGRPTQTPIPASILSNRGFYAGGITLMLATVALVLRPTATRVAVAAFGALALAVVVGADPFFSAVTALPGFRTAHNGRLIFLVLFALALLAGWGLDELTNRELAARTRRRLALAGAVAIFCVPFVWLAASGAIDLHQLRPALDVAWGFADPPTAAAGAAPDARTVDVIRLAALLEWLPLAGVGVVLVWLGLVRRWRVSAVVLVGCAVAVLAVDLFRANMGFNPAIPIEHAEQPQTPALRYLEARRPNRFAVLSRSGIDQPLQPDLAMRYRLYDARGYDYPVVRRYDDFWRASATTTGDFIEPTQRAGESPKALHALSLLSVTDLLHYPDGAAPRLPGLRLVYEGPDARVYRNGGALPRVFLVGSQRVVAGREAALAATVDPGFDARRVAVTERELPGLPRDVDGSGAGSARLVDYGEESARVEVEARRSALLVLTDVHFPGWEATVDGREVDIEQVDYLLRGVRVAAGRHVVEFRYRPASFTVGWIVSLLALIAIAATALTGWRRQRA